MGWAATAHEKVPRKVAAGIRFPHRMAEPKAAKFLRAPRMQEVIAEREADSSRLFTSPLPRLACPAMSARKRCVSLIDFPRGVVRPANYLNSPATADNLLRVDAGTDVKTFDGSRRLHTGDVRPDWR